MGEKLDNTPSWGSYDVKSDSIHYLPRQLRITPYGASRRTYYEQDWADKDAFWLVIDLKEQKKYYLPTIEACLKVCIYGKKAYLTLDRIARDELVFNNRWLVERISKIHFIKHSKRYKKQCWKYKEEVLDREERLDEIRRNRYRPVPLAKYESRTVQERELETNVPFPEDCELEHF